MIPNSPLTHPDERSLMVVSNDEEHCILYDGTDLPSLLVQADDAAGLKVLSTALPPTEDLHTDVCRDARRITPDRVVPTKTSMSTSNTMENLRDETESID